MTDHGLDLKYDEDSFFEQASPAESLANGLHLFA